MATWYAQQDGNMSAVRWTSMPDGGGNTLNFPPAETDTLNINHRTINFDVAYLKIAELVLVGTQSSQNLFLVGNALPQSSCTLEANVTYSGAYAGCIRPAGSSSEQRTFTIVGNVTVSELAYGTAVDLTAAPTNCNLKLVIRGDLRSLSPDTDTRALAFDGIDVAASVEYSRIWGSPNSETVRVVYSPHLNPLTFVQCTVDPEVYGSQGSYTWHAPILIHDYPPYCSSTVFTRCTLKGHSSTPAVSGAQLDFGSSMATSSVRAEECDLIWLYDADTSSFTQPVRTTHLDIINSRLIFRTPSGDTVLQPPGAGSIYYDHIGGVVQRAKPGQDLVFGWRVAIDGTGFRVTVYGTSREVLVKSVQPAKYDKYTYYFVLPGKFTLKEGWYMGVLEYDTPSYGTLQFRQFYAVGDIDHGIHFVGRETT